MRSLLTIYTIGFTKKSAEEFFRILGSTQARHLIDIRLNNTSQLTGFTKRDDLRYFLRKLLNIEYHEVKELAPEKNLLDAYRKNRDWANYERSYMALLKSRRAERQINTKLLEEGIILLCSEPKPDRCHRRLAAEYLAHLNTTYTIIVHL